MNNTKRSEASDEPQPIIHPASAISIISIIIIRSWEMPYTGTTN